MACCILDVVGKRETRNEDPESGAPVSFGARLRSLREAAGITQEELAFRAGLSPNAVSALERGARKQPYPHTVRSLSEALELSEKERAALLAVVPARGGAASSDEGISPASPAVSALPHPATPLVGREQELRELSDLLTQQGVRLLTLTGIGGVGKTRLAVEVAQEASGLFPDGAAFVGLAPLADPSLVVSTVLRSLGVAEAQGRTPTEALIDHLKDKALLLVLDNLEHLLGVAPDVSALIDACPRLVVLATSRAPLRLRGEREYPVPPLALPSSTRSPSEEEILASPSGLLFVERAQATSPGFEITPENASSVAAICWRLAGLPLALELAAAKARFLDPVALLSRLDQALSSAWARDLPERQRTMRSTLDWSHDLLSEPEQELFQRLSVFAGGFILEAAEAVGAAGNVGGEDDVLDLLGSLVEQSLVVTEVAGGYEMRYGMLEPVRQYALERLEENREAEETRRQHAAFFLGLAERADPEVRGPRQVEWLERLEQENDNLRAAMSWALSTGDYDTAVRLGWALQHFWWMRGHHREGRRWMEATLEHALPPALRARVLLVAGSMAYAYGDYPAAGEHWREALHLSRREGDVLAEAYAWGLMGLVEMVHPDYEAASSLEKGIALFERCGEEYLASVLRVFLGMMLLMQGESEQAERSFEEALASARRLKVPSLTYMVLYNLAQSALARGDRERAARMLGEGIEWAERTKDKANLACLLEALAAMVAFGGEAERCVLLLGAAEALLEEVGAAVYNFYQLDPSLRERAVAEARAALGDAAFEEAWARGRGMSFGQAVAYALEDDEASPA